MAALNPNNIFQQNVFNEILNQGEYIENAPAFSIRPSQKPSPDSLAEYLNSSENATGATIVITDKGSAGNIYQITNKFYLTGLQMSFKEKAQLLETFDSSFVSFFGDGVKVYNFQGQNVDYPSEGIEAAAARSMQQSSLMKLYKDHLRGSVLASKNQIASLRVLNHTIYGYPLNLNTSYSSSADKMATFAMS